MVKTKRAAMFIALLLLTHLSIFAQDAGREESAAQQNSPLGRIEVPDSDEQRRFVEEHSFNNPEFRRKQSERANMEAMPSAQGSKQVHMIYLVPSDKSFRADYQTAVADAISNLQGFYRDQMGGYTFSLHSPIVEVYQTPHTSAFYSTGSNARPGGFYESVLADGFALTGGGFNDPNNRWIIYIDADPTCGQYTGGTSGIALLPANDFRGLTGQPTIPVCQTDRSELLSINRWVGGLGHELGHAFNLPHPPGCDSGNCTGGQYAYNSLMYFGYYYYPNTYLLDENRALLLSGGFFSGLTYEIGGQVTLNNAGLAGVTVTLTGSQTGTTTTDAGGSYSFTVPAGGNYTITPSKSNYTFQPSSETFNNLSGNQAGNFSGTAVSSIELSAASYAIVEADGHLDITVNRRGDTSSAATVNYSTSDTAGLKNCNISEGSASSRCDYAKSVGTLRFAAGESARTISIPVIDDALVESMETFTLTLSGPVGATLGSASTATITITDNDQTTGPNPIDTTAFFVRQHYIDFLGREPDPAGYQAWLDILNKCKAGETSCDRIEVSSGFFRSAEFQERGYFIYRFYSVALGRKPDYAEFMPDIASVSGFLTDAEKEANKLAFVDEFMQRQAFKNKYDSQTTPTAYVDALLNTAGLQSHPSRAGWIAGLQNNSLTRARVLRELAESSESYNKFYNEAFVVMQYFGYLRRDPDIFYLDWIKTMNQNPANYRGMVDGFVNSAEYRQRFGP